MPSPATSRSHGFTLLEVLVALVLIGLLIGAVAPTVLSQIGKGEVNRVVEDLRSLETGAKLYRSDVTRWPQKLGQLATQPTGTSQDLYGKTLPGTGPQRWQGPYVERGVILGDSVPTAGGAVISAIDTVRWNGTLFIAFKVRGIDVAQAKLISATIDGDTVVRNPVADQNGRVRWRSGAGTDTLTYLAAPAK